MTFLSYPNWLKVGMGLPTATRAGIIARSRFLAVLGVATGALSVLLIAAQVFPAFFIDPCLE